MSEIQKREITKELQESYLDYAMSVIVSRALPDVRDGLKPVQRRILWAMWEMGLNHSSRFRKSANVVGDVMAKYHPHGDTAIYDTMVRLAQDFSLRYPLVEGQGNFGCFTKETKVKLADGRSLNFGELIEEHERGKQNYTYTVNSLGLISMAEIKHPRLTIKKTEIIKVILDNGEEIKCTPNHRFLLKNGTYKEASALSVKDSLMPLYERFSEKTDRINRDGYVLTYQPKKDEWVPAHHLADNFNLTLGKYKKSAGRVRHHSDFNKLNNSPENIQRMGWGEHWETHYKQAFEQHKNPEYRDKIAAGRKKYWTDPAVRAKYAESLSERNIKNWQNPEYRGKMSQFLSGVNKEYIKNHPEKRTELSARATRTLKSLWQNPEYRAFMHEKIIKGNKNHTTNRTGKLKFLKICEEALTQFRILNEENYNKVRKQVYPYKASTLWGTGLTKYFQGNPDLVRQEISQNHKIVKIEKISGKEDVYDLTVDGTHNFCLASGIFAHNSIDGDSAAAHRYTEARLSRISDEMLVDIEKETVDWAPNYDATKKEPMVLPAKLPNFLLNGNIGIAVGMATSVPPHNLTEIADAVLYLADNPDADTEDLLKFVKGPDFPTGGVIFDAKAIREAYVTGRGPIVVRAKATIEERKKDHYDIVVTEIPYMVNKSEMVKQIAELVVDKKIEGIRDLRDESDREGLRVVIELKNDASPQRVLNQLYLHTNLQKDFHMNMVALVNGIEPRTLSLREVLAEYLAYRKIIVRRRAEFDLKKAQERAHILEGLHKALASIDKVIATIKKSKDKEDAKVNLIKGFKLTDIQAGAILEMRLQTLAALERTKIEEELKEKLALIKELQLILKSTAKMLEIIKKEVKEIKDKYGDKRRTEVISAGLTEMTDEDLVPQEEAMITVSAGGYIKRLPPDTFASQKRGGKGLIGSNVSEEDFLTQFFTANTHDQILFFTDRGRVFQTRVYEIPPASRTAKGRAIHNFLEMPADEKVSAIVTYSEKKTEAKFLVLATRDGLIKKTPLEDFKNIRRTGIIAISLKKGDALKWAKLTGGADEILMATEGGQSIRFKESQARPMGRTAAGVRGMKLKKEDKVAGFDIIKKDAKQTLLLVVMGNGFGKLTPLSEYKVQNRGGSGIKTANVTAKTGKLISGHAVLGEEDLFALSQKGQVIRTELKSVRKTGRAAQGVRIMDLNAGDKLAAVAIL